MTNSFSAGVARVRRFLVNEQAGRVAAEPPPSIYAAPREVTSLDECFFYHTMELPGFGLVEGGWDLRAEIDAFLGHQDFAGKRVLEIGPASGYVTFEMERRGADVVAFEITDDPGWDFVPFPPEVLDPVYGPRREVMRKLKNSWWLAHRALGSRARIVYGDAYHLPEELGAFDIAVLANVLLHTRCPLSIVEQCARRANAVLIVDRLHADLEGAPLCRLHPSAENRDWGGWWHLSSDLFAQFFGVLGFGRINRTTHAAHAIHEAAQVAFYTIVGHKQ